MTDFIEYANFYIFSQLLEEANRLSIKETDKEHISWLLPKLETCGCINNHSFQTLLSKLYPESKLQKW